MSVFNVVSLTRKEFLVGKLEFALIPRAGSRGTPKSGCFS